MRKAGTTAIGMNPGTYNSKSAPLEPRITKEQVSEIEKLYMDECKAVEGFLAIKATADGICPRDLESVLVPRKSQTTTSKLRLEYLNAVKHKLLQA